MQNKNLTEAHRPPASKTCKACNIDKPIKKFSRNSKSGDGFNYQCRDCKKEYDKRREIEQAEYAKQYFTF